MWVFVDKHRYYDVCNKYLFPWFYFFLFFVHSFCMCIVLKYILFLSLLLNNCWTKSDQRNSSFFFKFCFAYNDQCKTFFFIVMCVCNWFACSKYYQVINVRQRVDLFNRMYVCWSHNHIILISNLNTKYDSCSVI